MKSGGKPTRINHLDYDYHRSFGSVVPPTFPVSYSTENGLWCPNQDVPDPTFNNPALPYGCTDYSQADLCNDIVGTLTYNPIMVEDIDHANALQGVDVRTSLNAILGMKWITGYFNVTPYQLDFFDSVRLAMISGIPEKRSVSCGTPWFDEFETVGTSGILPTPASFAVGADNTWHNHLIVGWKIINGETYLVDKSWQGTQFADNGYCYWSRSLFNTVMAIQGSVAYTATQGTLPPISTIPVSLLQWIVSNIKNFLGLQY